MSLSKDSGLQFGEVGESLEHIWSQAADPVVGQITVNRNKWDILSNPKYQSGQAKTKSSPQGHHYGLNLSVC